MSAVPPSRQEKETTFSIGFKRNKLAAPKLPTGPHIKQDGFHAAHLQNTRGIVTRIISSSVKSSNTERQGMFTKQKTPTTRRSLLLQAIGALGIFSGVLATDETYGEMNPFVAKPTKSADDLDKGLDYLRSRYPDLKQVEQKYDETMQRKFSGKQEKPVHPENSKNQFAIDSLHNPRLSFEVNSFVNTVSSALSLDTVVVKRLIVHESKGQVGAVSHKNAQGVMQILPSTASDIFEREQMYAPYIRRAGKAVLSKLSPNSSLREVLTVYLNESIPEANRTRTLKVFRAELFDQELNLFAGQIYLAMLRDYTAKRLPEFEKKLPELYANITERQLDIVNQSRRAIGERQLSLEYVRTAYVEKLEASARKSIEAQALAQYNGGSQPKMESYLYSLVLQA